MSGKQEKGNRMKTCAYRNGGPEGFIYGRRILRPYKTICPQAGFFNLGSTKSELEQGHAVSPLSFF